MDCIISFPTIEYFSKKYSEEILTVAKNFERDFNNMVKDEKITNINNYSGRLIGFDIPILLSPKSGLSDKTIVILGESPLREKSLQGTIVALPFGIGYKDGYCRRCDRYTRTIQNIIDKGYNVYVTDIIKIWTDEYIDKSKLKVSDVDITMLQDELNLLKNNNCNVVGIVCWGKTSFNAIKNIVQDTLYVPHPSQMNVNYWKKTYNDVDGTSESIVKKATKLILDSIVKRVSDGTLCS